MYYGHIPKGVDAEAARKTEDLVNESLKYCLCEGTRPCLIPNFLPVCWEEYAFLEMTGLCESFLKLEGRSWTW